MIKRKLIGRGQVTIHDYTDSKTLLAYIGSTLQRQVIFNPDSEKYSPDYSETPIELVPELYISGEPKNKVGNARKVTWYKQINSMWEYEEIVGGDTYTLEGVNLIINKNVLKENSTMRYQAKIIYPIEDSGGTQKDMVVLADIELVKLSSGSKGDDSLLSVINHPDGDTIRNHENNLRLVSVLYRGAKEVTPTEIRWYQLNPESDGEGELSGSGWERLDETTKTMIVTPKMFSGTGIYMSIQTYEGEHYRNTTTVRDVVDTSVTIIGPNVFKNGEGEITLMAKVYTVGEEVDVEGTKYTYYWSSYDTYGNHNKDFKEVGKEITLKADEVDNIVNIQCMVVKE